MTSDRIEEIQKTTAYPESRSVYQALLQVWNECEQENNAMNELFRNFIRTHYLTPKWEEYLKDNEQKLL